MIDESGSNLALALLYGWGPTNERVYASVPRNWGKNITVIAALTLQGVLMESVVYFEGATSTAIFETWVAQLLVPQLRRGQVVIMDNLSSHHSQKVGQLIEEAGCRLEYLPAYSPDYSPIEIAFSKCKSYLRKLGARSQDTLVAGWEQVLSEISGVQAAAMFRHCGYH